MAGRELRNTEVSSAEQARGSRFIGMSKDDDLDDEDDILPEYDFSNGVRGKFYRPGKSIIRMTIDEDVARYYWSSELINNALRQTHR